MKRISQVLAKGPQRHQLRHQSYTVQFHEEEHVGLSVVTYEKRMESSVLQWLGVDRNPEEKEFKPEIYPAVVTEACQRARETMKTMFCLHSSTSHPTTATNTTQTRATQLRLQAPAQHTHHHHMLAAYRGGVGQQRQLMYCLRLCDDDEARLPNSPVYAHIASPAPAAAASNPFAMSSASPFASLSLSTSLSAFSTMLSAAAGATAPLAAAQPATLPLAWTLCLPCLHASILDSCRPLATVADTFRVHREYIQRNTSAVPNPFALGQAFSGTEKETVHMPLGALLLVLLGVEVRERSQRSRAIGALLCVWLHATAMQTLKTSRYLVDTCPDHPHSLTAAVQYMTKSFVCTAPTADGYCGKTLCHGCKMWHGPSCPLDEKKSEELIAAMKRCPRCHFPSMRRDGCSHMKCHCGCHWCYACPVSPLFETSEACYEHMTKVHGGWYDNRN